MPNTVYISAGEASGDLLASQLAAAMLKKNPSLKLIGMGSSLMQQAGVDVLINSDELAVTGLWEPIRHLPKIYRAYQKIKKILREQKPQLIILVDYPGFNLRLAKYAKKIGIKVLFYVSPQIWAWRYGRINHIRRYIDHMAVLFKFEEAIYKKENVPVSFVGHPLADSVKPTLTKMAALTQFGLDANKPIIAIMPGSRRNEIAYLMPILKKAVALIKQQKPNAQFVLPLAKTISKDTLAAFLPDDVKVIENHTYDVISVADVSITASGTATLEVGLLGTPLTIIYAASPISAWVAKRVIKLPHIGLCNIVLGKTAARELLQEAATPENICQETLRLLDDPNYREQLISELRKIPTLLGSTNNAEKAADCALQLI